MGTNFYYKIPLKKREIEELKSCITEDPELKELQGMIYLYTKDRVVHLGKRSAGWQFLWNLNEEEYYKPNLASIKEFLESKKGWVEGEYGDRFTIEQFFEDEIGDWLYHDENHHNAISYHKAHPDEYCYGIPGNDEFESDGLRFSKHSEFS